MRYIDTSPLLLIIFCSVYFWLRHEILNKSPCYYNTSTSIIYAAVKHIFVKWVTSAQYYMKMDRNHLEKLPLKTSNCCHSTTQSLNLILHRRIFKAYFILSSFEPWLRLVLKSSLSRSWHTKLHTKWQIWVIVSKEINSVLQIMEFLVPGKNDMACVIF